MKGSEIYIGWENSTGEYTVGDYFGIGHTQPRLNESPNHSVVALRDPAPSWSLQSFSFCRPTTLSSNGNSITPTAGFIFAGSNSAPSGNRDSARIRLEEHDVRGVFQPDFSAGSTVTTTGSGINGSNSTIGEFSFPHGILSPSSSFSYQTMLITHGSLMFIAWVISPFIGIYIARYLKNTLGHTWYILHVFFMAAVTGAGTIASFLLIFLYSPDRFSTDDSTVGDYHEKIGLAVAITVVIQVVLGFVCNAAYDPDRTLIPWWDQLHWWLGRSLFLIGVLNVYLGILYYQERFDAVWAIPAFWGFLVLGIALFATANYKDSKDSKSMK
ncbi:DOMON domain-containing protein frrs1L [Boothiomyces macroporosus]|uniref:DOMON domain-containing protein frrs1L n=1 Tax=Boothiomyces macroporosus TaxID=261099 RepID=A0AAD5UIB9_9FUNG|nr:DOMON domain-containing protein frrs1L [Boothiomyces macroporosus]